MSAEAATTTATTAAMSSAAFPLSGRLRSVLLDPPNPDALQDALAALAHLYPAPPDSNSEAAEQTVDIARARRNVLDDLDAHLLAAADELEQAYAPAVSAIQELCTVVDEVVAETKETHARFEDVYARTATLLAESDSLQKQRVALTWQSEQTSLFLRKFSLNDAELLILDNPAAAAAEAPASSSSSSSSSHGIGKPFFQVIDRLEQIREDCAELLGLVEEDEDDIEEEAAPPTAPESVNDAQALTMATPLPSTRDPSERKDMMRAGMHILRITSEQLNTAHSRLARWCTFEFRQPFREGVEVSPVMREAVCRLAEGGREDLLGPALSTLTQTRSTAITREFNAALTQGGPPPTHLPRPIELSAHDPTRYIGDMLAWVHQALASERELLGSLVGIGDDDVATHHRGAASPSSSGTAEGSETQMMTGRRIGQRRRWSVNPAEVIDMMEGRNQTGAPSDNEALAGSLAMASAATAQKGVIRPRERLRDLLDRDMEGCCRPLKVRITQTLHSQEGSITAFKLSSLISFYSSTMEQTIGRKAALSQVLRELTETAYSAFFATLDRQAAGLMRFAAPPESDLSPPPPLLGACSTLKELLALHHSASEEGDLYQPPPKLPSSGNQAIPEEPALSDFSHVVKKLVDPILTMCDQMADSLRASIARRSVGSVSRLGVSFTGRGAAASKTKADTEGGEQWEVTVFLANCWSYVLGFLEAYDFVGEKVDEMRKRIDEKAEALTKLYYRYMLSQSGLAPLTTSEDGALLPPDEVDKHLSNLDKFLASPSAILISHSSLSKLQPAHLRNGINARALSLLADAYGTVYEKYGQFVVDGDGGGGSGRKVVRRTVDEVRLLLGAEIAQN
ncbi:unnamed protein product [Tilletia controversa]|uniref:Conserved oligomeric Golgi complex subunit 6 n=1 Tax=Tilletia controversa TaxID=13291 RepID=A0A8X7N0W6_9BASI|nr:hypothetical protein CF328_g11 [Tilletia controversa]KAE8256104.1 hypothetical protein A4X06_0g70 [Tilletia controversa]CAD6930556.1 unnamed protein product [Tilletia controversa]CAD6984040.1 unnamed protein product [Tilletia controversa]